MSESSKVNGGATSGDGIPTENKSIYGDSSNSKGRRNTESIVIDLGGLTESDLMISANNNYEVTEEDPNRNSGSAETKLKETEVQNAATEMVENVIDRANERISADNSKFNETSKQQEAVEHFDESNSTHPGADGRLGESQMSSFANISMTTESQEEECKTYQKDTDTVTKSKPLGDDKEILDNPSTADLKVSSKSANEVTAEDNQDVQTHVTTPDRVDTDDSKQSWEVISDSLLDANVTQTTSIGSSTLNVSIEVPSSKRTHDEQLEGDKEQTVKDVSESEATNEQHQCILQAETSTAHQDESHLVLEPAHGNSVEEGSKEQTMAVTESPEQKSDILPQEVEKPANDQSIEDNTEETMPEVKEIDSTKSAASIQHPTNDGSGQQDRIETELLNKPPATELEQSALVREKVEKSKEAADEWVDVLGNGLLRKKVIHEGDGITTRPVRENEIIVKYVAKLKGGDQVVDFNESLALVLGEQESLDLFDIVCALMQKGETSLVESDAKYAYGEKGKPPLIPPNATIEFEIELLHVNDGPYSSDVDLVKRLTWADKQRHRGNELYSQHKYLEATMAYMRASKSLEKGWMNEKSDEGRSRINELRLKCYNNLTVAHMKSLKWTDALKSCRAAEKLDRDNVKTLYRKGKILCELGELENGIRSLKKALALEPENKAISTELTKQSKKLERQTEKHQRMCQKMLGNIAVKKDEAKVIRKSWFTNNWSRLIGGTLAVGVLLVGIYAAQRL